MKLKSKLIQKKSNAELCPLLQDKCKHEECMWYHEDFEKCYMPLLGLNLYKTAISTDALTVELKKH